LFIFNIFYSKVKARSLANPGPDPWDARTLEWMIPSPAPEYNFDPIPTVTRLDDFWYRKYGETEDGRLVRIAATEDVTQSAEGEHNVHLPSPSYWPLVTAIGLPIIAYGIIYTLWLALLGAVITVGALYAWALEPPDDPGAAHDDHHDPEAGASPDSHEAVASVNGDNGTSADSAEREVETVG
jgi:cytochrome c oxidase subunit 1